MEQEKYEGGERKGESEQIGLSRRGFLTGAVTVGAATAAAALAGCAPQAASTGSGGSGSNAATSRGTDAAGGAVDWLGAEPTIDEADIAETIETEVLIVGGGTGGLFAACSAGEEGAKVLVIDKYESGGIRNDLGGINSRYQKELGVTFDPHEVVRECYRYSSGNMIPDLHYLWIQESGETIDWYGDRLAERDVKLWLEYTTEHEHVNYKHFPTGHSPAWPVNEEGEATLDGATVLTEYATGLGVTFRYNTPMIKLVKTGDAVTGVIAEDTANGGYVQINASKGVIVCTGGYAENKEMYKERQPVNWYTSGWASIIPGCSGDGIKACVWAGAKFEETTCSCNFDRCAVTPGTYPEGHDSGGQFFWLGEQPFMKVNLHGKRFTNESGTYDYIAHAAYKQPNRSYVTIWDANYQEDIVRFDMHGCSRTFENENGAPPDIPLAVAAGMFDGLVEAGLAQKADTLEELAEKCLLPTDEFVASVARYNELFDKGSDDDYGKEPFRLSAIKEPPFYGTWTCVYTLSTLDGIIIDTEMRALNEAGEPIEGLYVVGNDSGGYYANHYPNLFTGHACGRTVTFGRRAGKIVASN